MSKVHCLIAVGGGIESKTEVQIAILPDKFRLFYDNIASVVQNHCKRLLFLLFLFFHHNVLTICQHLIELAVLRGLELTVIDLYAVVKVKLDTGKCQMADLLIIFPAFLQLLGEFILAFRGRCHFTGILAVIHHILHPVDLGFIHALHLVQVVDAQVTDGIRRVAVQVDQCLKAVLLAAVKQPVDRTLAGTGDRVGLAVILEEIVQEVVTDNLPTGIALVAKGFAM